ncbi:MAG: hypothetical protein WBA97_11095 [Actinophytocola sp.]|uniref:hypothetical protein n=1 Tax=Actinophytocola sp. TaxID=1872138 RepID=UPI003C794A39
MARRLRRSDPGTPGLRRQRSGRGWRYFDADDEPVRDAEVVSRVNGLAIPPAWQEVWICPFPNGHLQAVGTDVAGPRQYLYHDQWREDRDEAKHERALRLAARLPEEGGGRPHRGRSPGNRTRGGPHSQTVLTSRRNAVWRERCGTLVPVAARRSASRSPFNGNPASGHAIACTAQWPPPWSSAAAGTRSSPRAYPARPSPR